MEYRYLMRTLLSLLRSITRSAGYSVGAISCAYLSLVSEKQCVGFTLVCAHTNTPPT